MKIFTFLILLFWMIQPAIATVKNIPKKSEKTLLQQTAQGVKPNIILILADDMGWTAPACYGSDTHLTPNIDRLAEQGVLFTDAYAACPVCSPTRASVVSGQYPARLHLTDWIASTRDIFWDYSKLKEPDWADRFSYEETTVADLLKEAGYTTGHVGKWHLEKYGVADPLKHGFDYTIGGKLKGDFFLKAERNPGVVERDQYRTDFLTDQALRLMNEWQEKPFFIYLALYNPHRPIQGKPDLVEYYKNRIKPGATHSNPEYAAMIHNFDENVGRIMAELDKLGLTDNTLLLFTSDNGGLTHDFGKFIHVTDNNPLLHGKGSCYEGGVREPWIVRWPGVTPAGEVCREPVSTIDLLPTFISAAGVEHDGVVDGVDLGPVLRNPEKKLGREALYWHYPHYHPGQASGPYSSVRSGNWKLIEFFEDDHVELYNLAEDLRETENLAEKEPEQAAELKKMLHDWRKEVNAQLPVANPDYDPDRETEFEWRSVKGEE